MVRYVPHNLALVWIAHWLPTASVYISVYQKIFKEEVRTCTLSEAGLDLFFAGIGR